MTLVHTLNTVAIVLVFVTLIVQLVCWYGRVGHWEVNRRAYHRYERLIERLRHQSDGLQKAIDEAIDYRTIEKLVGEKMKTDLLIERFRGMRAEIWVEFRSAGKLDDLE